MLFFLTISGAIQERSILSCSLNYYASFIEIQDSPSLGNIFFNSMNGSRDMSHPRIEVNNVVHPSANQTYERTHSRDTKFALHAKSKSEFEFCDKNGKNGFPYSLSQNCNGIWRTAMYSKKIV